MRQPFAPISTLLLSSLALCMLNLQGESHTSLFNSVINVAHAAEWTDVIDAADGKDPFDFTAEVFYRRHLRRAKLTREYNCDSLSNDVDQQTCPGSGIGGSIVNVKELRYQRWTHEMVPRLHLGLWKDLELLIEAPIVIQDEQQVRYAGNGGDTTGASIIIDGNNSSVVPNVGQRLFDLPGVLPVRAGFGDMLFMFRFAPISNERDDSRGEWVLELGYRAPTGTPMKYGNAGVGRGLHELEIGTAFSRRYRYVEPFSRFQMTYPFQAATKSYFQQYWGSQEYVTPGLRARFDFGAEIIPYYHSKSGAKFFLTLGLGAGYQAEGRNYSELFDALAGGAPSCNPMDTANNKDGKQNCAQYNPDARWNGVADQAPIVFDGITTVEQFITLRGHLGFGFYASHNIKLGATAALAHETEHNLTNAEIGKDIFFDTTDQIGVLTPSKTQNEALEHNPTFVPALDTVGRRIRIEETTVFSATVQLAVMF